MLGRDAHAAIRGSISVDLDTLADQGLGLALVKFKEFSASLIKQARAGCECSRDRGDQHRLLGIGWAAHATRSQVPAAFDVAWDDLGANAQLLSASAQQFVVGVGLPFPVVNIQALFSLFEPWRTMNHYYLN